MEAIQLHNIDELLHLPMTEFEYSLKNYTDSHPEWKDRILTSSELSVFLGEYFATRKEFQNKEDGRWSWMDSDLRNCQQEKTFIPQKFDISVGRMLRYMPAHWHTNDYFELYYVFTGSCELHFENEVITMGPGTIVLLSPATRHASPCYSDDCVLFYYMIRTSTFNMVFWNNLTDQDLMSAFFRKALNGEGGKSYLHFETREDGGIQSLLYEIYKEYQSGDIYSPQMMNSMMSMFFIRLLRSYKNEVYLPSDASFHWNPCFGEIFSYIQNHYHTVTLKDLAEQFNYSERQLTRIIYAATNRNFSEVLLDLRMHNAAGYLATTSLSAEKIAELVGYGNASSFYRAFGKFHGCSPSEYRRKAADFQH